MSSTLPSTRTRILHSALELVQSGETDLSMSKIAREAGLSRQALYLSFSDKADLFVALLRYADGQIGMVQEQARLRAMATGFDTLIAIIDLQARIGLAAKPMIDAFDRLRIRDVAAQSAWQDRQRDRLAGCHAAVLRLQADGRLRRDIEVDEAADLIWTATSSRTWDDLVITRGWTAEAYRRRMAEIVIRLVVTSNAEAGVVAGNSSYEPSIGQTSTTP